MSCFDNKHMGGPIDKSRKAIKKEQHDSSPPVAEFEGPQSHLVRAIVSAAHGICAGSDHCLRIDRNCGTNERLCNCVHHVTTAKLTAGRWCRKGCLGHTCASTERTAGDRG